MLEVMVAVTIFSLISVIIFSVFRTSMRSHEIGVRESEQIQRARFIVDSLERDINNIFFRDETSYNVQITRLIEEFERIRLEAELSNDWSIFEQNYGSLDGREDGAIGNPFERGRIIDLQFVGEDHGGTDELTFVTFRPLTIGGEYRPWGLERVRYSANNGTLIRRSESVESPPRGVTGEMRQKPYPPQVDILAEGVKAFALSYGFWYDNQWYEVTKWNSSNRQIRNPRYLLGTYDFRSDEITPGALRPGLPGWNEYLNDLANEPLDRLPSYIRIRVTVADPDTGRRPYTLQSILRLPGSQETFIPNTDLPEEDQRMERAERDSRYYQVFPGAMEARFR